MFAGEGGKRKDRKRTRTSENQAADLLKWRDLDCGVKRAKFIKIQTEGTANKLSVTLK